jgi:hypothetical protein
MGPEGKQIAGSLYCKVVGVATDSNDGISVHFTSMSQEIETFIRDLLEQ